MKFTELLTERKAVAELVESTVLNWIRYREMPGYCEETDPYKWYYLASEDGFGGDGKGGGCFRMTDNSMWQTKESYDELKALIKDCGCLIRKADPRLDTDHPLTMEDLKTMVGEPVWNSNTGKWGLVKEVREDDVTLVYQAADWVITGREDLKKFPLYRMKKNVAGSKRRDENDDTA